MNISKIDKLFADFIIDLVGSTPERDYLRKTKIDMIKPIIEKSLLLDFPHLNPYILIYGSFSIKSYLKDADIDITILFEEKNSKELITNFSHEMTNNIILSIKNSFDQYNFETKSESFKEITTINADIRLLKSKFDEFNLDISINNLSGLIKILLMSFIEAEFEKKSVLFKRTLLFVKAWAYYEGNIMGSNIGLMASYALEILVLYVFNNFDVQSEVDGFKKFFEVIYNVDWENEILHLFGTIDLNDFNEGFAKVVNSEEIILHPFWYVCSNKEEDKKDENFCGANNDFNNNHLRDSNDNNNNINNNDNVNNNDNINNNNEINNNDNNIDNNDNENNNKNN